jgi:hypothetical protein
MQNFETSFLLRPLVRVIGIETHRFVKATSVPLVTSATQAMVFHALGGNKDWFQRTVVPHIRYWAAHVFGILVNSSCVNHADGTLQNSRQACTRPAIDYLIEQGLTDLGRWVAHPTKTSTFKFAALSPANKLIKLHQVIIDGLWCLMQGIEIEADDGAVWRLGDTLLQVWFEQHDSANINLRYTKSINEDIWREAIEILIHKEIWGLSTSGRWIPTHPIPSLLWPLAGRDLQQTLGEMGYPEYSLEYVQRGLKHWGYTNPNCLSGDLFSWARPDGKTLFGLRAAPRLMNVMSDSGVAYPANGLCDEAPVVWVG